MDSLPILDPRKERVCPKYLKRPIHAKNAKPSLKLKIEHALAMDDKAEFVRLINSVSNLNDLTEGILSDIFFYDSVECASAVLAGETNGIFDLKAAISKTGLTPLHMAAQEAAYYLISFFLESGEDADMRDDLKKVLPLNVALSKIREYTYKDLVDKSASHLVALLSDPKRRRWLETLRLLARKTKGIDQEVAYYFNEGKMIECGALLMVNCVPSEVPLGKHEGDKSERERAGTLLLLKIFEKIGDKLQAYIRIHRPKGSTLKDMGTLFEDAGLPFESKCNSTYKSFVRPLRRDAIVKEMQNELLGPEVQQALCGSKYGLQGSILGLNTLHNGLGTQQAFGASRLNSHEPVIGKRAFHASSLVSSSILKAEAVQPHSLANLGPKLCLSKGCMFIMAILRKGVKRV